MHRSRCLALMASSAIPSTVGLGELLHLALTLFSASKAGMALLMTSAYTPARRIRVILVGEPSGLAVAAVGGGVATAAAGDQGQGHHQGQEQGKQFLHFFSS
jgi:hypothetical protein